MPVFSKEKCPGCGRVIWVKYSRVDPEAFTEAGLAERYDIDEATKNATEKVGR